MFWYFLMQIVLANVSYAIWSSSQGGLSFNIFPSTRFWLTQNTKISKQLVCQDVSFPRLLDCQYFQNDWRSKVMLHKLLSCFGFFHFQFCFISKLLFLKFYKPLQTKKPISHQGAASGTPFTSSQMFSQRDVSASAAHSHLELIINCLLLHLSHTGTW